ncbi:MAG: hypothetical protein AAFR38_01655 [Planctomycetota bacterium]
MGETGGDRESALGLFRRALDDLESALRAQASPDEPEVLESMSRAECSLSDLTRLCLEHDVARSHRVTLAAVQLNQQIGAMRKTLSIFGEYRVREREELWDVTRQILDTSVSTSRDLLRKAEFNM